MSRWAIKFVFATATNVTASLAFGLPGWLLSVALIFAFWEEVKPNE